jgi:carboxyl-terminal processing protease
VQREIALSDGSKIRLTTARYYTPTGRSIQRPYQKGHPWEYEQDFQKRQYNGELYYKDSIPKIDSLKYTTPKGKIVYGGGGIIPDIFVPLNPNDYIYQYSYLNRFLSEFITDYLDQHIDSLQTLTPQQYITNAKIADDLYRHFINKHGSKSAKKHKLENDQTREQLKTLMKALLARDLYGTNTYYQILIKNDAMLQQIIPQKKLKHVK